MKTLKRSLGILASVILVIGLFAGTALPADNQAQTPIPGQNEEEFWNKLAQDLALLELTLRLETEKEAVGEVISRLEKFKAKNAKLKKKINKDWLPTLKEYRKALEGLIEKVRKLSNQEKLIPKEEIEAELLKNYPSDIEIRVGRIIGEMIQTGVLQKLQEQE